VESSRNHFIVNTLLICVVCLTLVSDAAGQERLTYTSAEDLQRDVTFLLLGKNINDVTRELAAESPATADSLLRRLVIYSRAGQLSRVRETLRQLPATANWHCPAGADLRWLIRTANGGDFLARRFYYETICPDDVEGADEFIPLWLRNADQKQLDAWLAERSNRSDEWLMRRVQLRAKSGTAAEVLDQLAAEVRANPADWALLDRYLKANNYAGNIQDLKWLADTFEAGTAFDYFQLAERLRHYSPETGVKLLQKSLDVPFTNEDAKRVDNLLNRFRSAGPSIKVNWEKQLRYWTKRSLAETYQRMNQSLAAQPLIEELVAMKGDDILLQDVHQLAGAVQNDSGQRVVETKILRDEVARRSTSEYWLERARYYDGRHEYGRQRDSYRQALVALPVKPEDRNAQNERYEVVRSFAFFLGEEHNGKEDKPELEKLLATELRSVPPETDYAFQIATLITQNELNLSTLRYSLLAQQPLLLARLLDGRREWENEEKGLIEDVVRQDEVSSDLKEKIWSRLEPLARDPGSTRAYQLAQAMTADDQWQRAIPLLRGYIEHAYPTNWEGYKTEAMSDLFTAYCRTKQWQAAEKLLLAQPKSMWRSLPQALAEVAIVAAQQNEIDDAMRLWRMSTNLDRRNLESLPQLAQTNARPQLLAMYLQMKKEDPLSTVPDLALQILR
jgi:hypothetical protein